MKRKLLSDSAGVFSYLDKASLSNLVSEHLNGQQNRRLLVWSLLSFEKWMECFHVR